MFLFRTGESMTIAGHDCASYWERRERRGSRFRTVLERRDNQLGNVSSCGVPAGGRQSVRKREDFVAKVSGARLVRNNQTQEARRLNQSCSAW